MKQTEKSKDERKHIWENLEVGLVTGMAGPRGSDDAVKTFYLLAFPFSVFCSF